MGVLANIFLILCIVVAVCYSLLILYFTFSWINIPAWKQKRTDHKTKVSIVIPVRNESSNIFSCLQCIHFQDYPPELLEIIFCDDSSTDDTAEVIKDYIQQSDHNIRLLELSVKNLMFKKQAITEAVTVANGQLIIVTDGDCTMGSKWVSSIVDYFEEKQLAMIIGPVIFNSSKGLFHKLQNLEFMSLVASGLGSVNGNFPVMCNGANIAYTKEAFLKADGYAGNTRYASGDDIFLLLKIKKHFAGKIGVIKSTDACVFTNAPKDLKSFISQRLRWVSKSRGYKSFPVIFTSSVVYLANFLIILCGIFSFFNDRILPALLIISLTKIITDLPILLCISGFTKKRKLLIYYFPLQIIYVFYVTMIGFAGNFAGSIWKGRKIS